MRSGAILGAFVAQRGQTETPPVFVLLGEDHSHWTQHQWSLWTYYHKINVIIIITDFTFYIMNCFHNIDLVSLSNHALLSHQHYAQTTFYRVHEVRKVLILQINSLTLTFQKMLLLFIVSVNTLCSYWCSRWRDIILLLLFPLQHLAIIMVSLGEHITAA